jgi:phospholipase C
VEAREGGRTDANLEKVDHVGVVMLENRPFDAATGELRRRGHPANEP